MIRGTGAGAAPGGTVNFVTRAACCCEGGGAITAGGRGGVAGVLCSIWRAMTDVPNAMPGSIHRRMFHGDFIQYVVDWPAGS